MQLKTEDLYKWQIEYINHEGDTTIRGGRQCGKSMAAAKRIINLAFKYPNCTILIIAASERQENYLLDKVKIELGKNFEYDGRATTTRLPLPNGTIIYKFPVGKTGVYVEGLSSVDFLFVDEAIHLGEKVYDSILPMLAEPKKRGFGWINLLSATKGRAKGFFFESFKLKRFKQFVIKAGDQPHISQEFLRDEKKRLGEEMFGVVYNGDFSENALKYWPPDLIKRNARFYVWNYKQDYIESAKYYLGIDPAGQGPNEAAFIVAENLGETWRIVYWEVIGKSSMIELRKKTLELHGYFKFAKIFIDPGGLGVGLVDMLTEEKLLKRKIRPLNNKEGGMHGKIFKEDLYSNAKKMLEKNLVEIINDEKLIKDLCDVETDESEKIYGTDLSEAFVRALWGSKEKSLKPKVLRF